MNLLAREFGFGSFVPAEKQICDYKVKYDLSDEKIKGCFDYLQETYDESDYQEYKYKARLPADIVNTSPEEQDLYCWAKFEEEKTNELLKRVSIGWDLHDCIIFLMQQLKIDVCVKKI